MSASASPALAASAASAICWAAAMNSSFLATKSVSQLSSTSAPPAVATRPAEAVRSAPRFFGLGLALDAQDLDGLVEVAVGLLRAFLLSIMPAPVWSRSFLTSAAVIAMSLHSLVLSWGSGGGAPAAARGVVPRAADRVRPGSRRPSARPPGASAVGLGLGSSAFASAGASVASAASVAAGVASAASVDAPVASAAGATGASAAAVSPPVAATAACSASPCEQLALPLGQRLLGARRGLALAGLGAGAGDQAVGDGVGDHAGQQRRRRGSRRRCPGSGSRPGRGRSWSPGCR